MSDAQTQLAALRSLRTTVTDQAQAVALDAAIALLEAAQTPPNADAMVSELTTRQVIGGAAQIGVAVAGNVHGNIYIAGRRLRPAERLLADYLARLVQRSSDIPLQGIREQRTSNDLLRIGLDQVYTQLALTAVVERETYDRTALATFEIGAFFAQQADQSILPFALRRAIRVQRPAEPAAAVTTDALAPMQVRKDAERLDLAYITPDDLAVLLAEAEKVSLFGPQLVTEAVASQRLLVLLGEPGSGKSTALKYIALMLARTAIDEELEPATFLIGWQAIGRRQRLLPILVALLPFARWLAEHPGAPADADTLWNFIADQLEAGGRYPDLPAAVADELEAGRAIVLLDGLDEVVGAQGRARVVQAVAAFASAYTKCHMVVTCRVRAYLGPQNSAWQLAGWPAVVLADWTIGQMQQFVASWYDAAAASSRMEIARRDERVAALQQAINQRADLQRLGVRPLLLTIMALVHYNDGRLPEDRVTLYSRSIDLLLGQWELAREQGSDYGTLMQHIGMPTADVKSLRPLLERAAFRAHEGGANNGTGSLSRAVLRDMVAETLQQRGHQDPWDGANRFLEYADMRAGLLQASDAGDAYVFPHQTFQEYLAGLELVRDVEFVKRIMERHTDDRWRVPITLAIGHLVSEGALAMPYQLLNQLLLDDNRSPTEEQRDWLFAADIAADVGWDRLERGGAPFKHLRRNLAEALVRVLGGGVLPATERVRAGRLLNLLGDPRPGVCGLPPALVPIAAGTVRLGSDADEVQAIGLEYEKHYQQRGNRTTARQARRWPESELGDEPRPIASFTISRYLITNAQYSLFIAEHGYEIDAPWWDTAGRTWRTRDDARSDGLTPWRRRATKHQPEFWHDLRFGAARPNHPVVGVTLYEAMAFCRWLSQHQQHNPQQHDFHLPSEDEWEYAARSTVRRFAWGDDEPDAERANYGDMLRETTAVGSFAAGSTPEGIADLAGNVWEWTRSRFQPYPYHPDDGRELPPINDRRTYTARGASWHSRSSRLRAATRNLNTPDTHFNDLGFRVCAYTHEQGKQSHEDAEARSE